MMIGIHFLKAVTGLLLLVALMACDVAVPKPTDESTGSPAAASPTVIQFEIPTGGNGRASSVAALPLGSDTVGRQGKLVPVKASFPAGFTHRKNAHGGNEWTLSEAAPDATREWIDDGGVAVWTWSVDNTGWHGGLTMANANGVLVPGQVELTLHPGCAYGARGSSGPDDPYDPDSDPHNPQTPAEILAYEQQCVADRLREFGGTTLYVRVRLLDP